MYNIKYHICLSGLRISLYWVLEAKFSEFDCFAEHKVFIASYNIANSIPKMSKARITFLFNM